MIEAQTTIESNVFATPRYAFTTSVDLKEFKFWLKLCVLLARLIIFKNSIPRIRG